MSKAFEITTKVKIADNDSLGDILITAFEGGIGYWSGSYEPSGDAPEGYDPKVDPRYAVWLNEPSDRTLVLSVDEEGEGEEAILTHENLVKGFLRWLNEYADMANVMHDGAIDMGAIDAGDADNIVQLAVFDDIVYG